MPAKTPLRRVKSSLEYGAQSWAGISSPSVSVTADLFVIVPEAARSPGTLEFKRSLARPAQWSIARYRAKSVPGLSDQVTARQRLSPLALA